MDIMSQSTHIHAHSHIQNINSLIGENYQKLSDRAILISGSVSSDKTALALSIELVSTPFVMISASQVYSQELKASEHLTCYMWQAIRLKIKKRNKFMKA